MKATPLFDEWRTDAARDLAAFGRKAELARHLTDLYGGESRSWEGVIARILSGRRMPAAETLLAMSRWLTAQSLGHDGPKAAKRRKKSG